MRDTFKASEIQEHIVPLAERKPVPDKSEIVFGRIFTDHMVECNWDEETGWDIPQIKPYGDFELDPACSVLHYAIECFEGMKAYLGPNDEVLMYRPELNFRRMNKSTARVTLPTFDPKEAVECLKQLLKHEKRWIPKGDGYSLYLRPTVISTTARLGLGPTSKAKFYIICCPVGPYMASGFAPVTLYADAYHVRAWPGGAGSAKIGGNYAPTITVQAEAKKKHGAEQVLWLMPKDDDYYVSEAGVMNMFCLLVNEKGEKELVTQPLDDGTVLAGITRQSVLELAREWGEFKVSERMWGMKEVVKAVEEHRMLEIFGTGTACLIAPINGIIWQDRKLAIPLDPNDADAGIGPTAKRLCKTIFDIQYGRAEHPWCEKVE